MKDWFFNFTQDGNFLMDGAGNCVGNIYEQACVKEIEAAILAAKKNAALIEFLPVASKNIELDNFSP